MPSEAPLALAALAHGALLDALFIGVVMDNALHKDAGRVNLVGVDLTCRDEVLDFGDRDAAGGRHHRVEIARGLAKNEVTLGIRLPGVDDRKIGDEAAFHHIGLSVEIADLLALGDKRADAGLGEEGRDTGTPGADALGQGALRVEFELELALQVKLGEELVL